MSLWALGREDGNKGAPMCRVLSPNGQRGGGSGWDANVSRAWANPCGHRGRGGTKVNTFLNV